jgi:hypothetical protein
VGAAKVEKLRVAFDVPRKKPGQMTFLEYIEHAFARRRAKSARAA